MGKELEKQIFLNLLFENSILLRKATRVVKITGRYKILNIDKIIRKVIISNADVHVNFDRNLIRCDSRIIIFKPFFYTNYFKKKLETIDFEFALASSVHNLMSDGFIFEPWPCYPYYEGINGSTGRIIKFSVIKRFKYYVYYKLKLYFLKNVL